MPLRLNSNKARKQILPFGALFKYLVPIAGLAIAFI
jgi:hypothetical protein